MVEIGFRADGSLAKKFIVERIKNGNSITAVQLFGYNLKHQISKQISKDIVKKIKSMNCAVLNVGGVEVDHKDGHRDDYFNLKIENQKFEDFQPLKDVVNKAKRQHCKNCRNTKKRFNAKVLGYYSGYWVGDEKYRGSCVGCYWFDVKKFNYEISKFFKTST